jgi:arylsulfatase A-like enzyme
MQSTILKHLKNNLSLKAFTALQIILVVLFLGGIQSCKNLGQDKTPPNFIFVLVDDLGWNDLGCYGSEFYETPNIDRLASHSVLFTNAYASASICSPSRASIMSGKSPARLNITDWIPGHDPKERKLLGPQDIHALPLDEVTLPEVLKNNGYNTFFCGKWHLGEEGFFPEDQGFDINIGGHHKGSPPGGYYSPYLNPKLSDGPEGEYLTDRLTDESIKFIRDHRDSTFFLFLSFYTVHTPIQASKKHIEKFMTKAESLPGKGQPEMIEEGGGRTVLSQYNARYASMVHAMDENLGRLMEVLHETELWENTIIIFTSDNGGLSTLASTRGAAPTSVKPLRAGKGWLYEGGIRVPLLIKPNFPIGVDFRGDVTEILINSFTNVCDVPVTGTDYFPTILALAGLPEMPEQHIDGIDLSPLIKGKQKLSREEIFWHYPHYHGSAWKPGAAIRQGDWKLIEFYESGKTELYNLKNDLGEESDLSEKHPDIVNSLKQRLHSLQEESGAKFPIENPGWNAGAE